MPVYQVVQKNLAFMGYSPNERSFNRRQIQIGVAMAMCVSVNFIFLIHVANTPQQLMASIHHTSVSILILISFMSTAYKMDIIFTIVDKMQAIVNESKFGSNRTFSFLGSFRFDKPSHFHSRITKSQVESNV